MRQIFKSSLIPMALATLGLLMGSSSCSASIIQFVGTLQPQTAGPPAPTGTGYSTANVDTVARTLAFETQWSGLNGTVSASHIHGKGGVTPYVYPSANWAAALNMAGGTSGFPTTTSGTFSKIYGIADLGASFVRQENSLASSVTVFTIAERELAFDNLVTYLGSGNAYYNIHTASQNTGGSLANFYVAVPEPGSFAVLTLLGITGAAYRKRKRK